MLLVIDNYDSFTYNLVQYFGELGAELIVKRNDEVTIEEIEAELQPTRILISPGPGEPRDAGISRSVIERFAGRVPVLGVCLGHQAIGEVFGGRTVRASVPVHGKATRITHDGRNVFRGLPSPFEVGRYHSLVIERETLPQCLEISAMSDDGIIMAIRHRELMIEGVQFHPESILTAYGKQMLANFIGLTND